MSVRTYVNSEYRTAEKNGTSLYVEVVNNSNLKTCDARKAGGLTKIIAYTEG